MPESFNDVNIFICRVFRNIYQIHTFPSDKVVTQLLFLLYVVITFKRSKDFVGIELIKFGKYW